MLDDFFFTHGVAECIGVPNYEANLERVKVSPKVDPSLPNVWSRPKYDHPQLKIMYIQHMHAKAFGECASAYLNNLQTVDTKLFDYPTLVLNPALYSSLSDTKNGTTSKL